MTKEFIINKVKDGNYTPEQLIGWVCAMPSSKYDRGITPSGYRVGDVFMHDVFMHPYVLLNNNRRSGEWVGVLLTSTETCPEILYKCESRLFEKSFFCKSLFTIQNPGRNQFMAEFGNDKQLKEVYKEIKKLL